MSSLDAGPAPPSRSASAASPPAGPPAASDPPVPPPPSALPLIAAAWRGSIPDPSATSAADGSAAKTEPTPPSSHERRPAHARWSGVLPPPSARDAEDGWRSTSLSMTDRSDGSVPDDAAKWSAVHPRGAASASLAAGGYASCTAATPASHRARVETATWRGSLPAPSGTDAARGCASTRPFRRHGCAPGLAHAAWSGSCDDGGPARADAPRGCAARTDRASASHPSPRSARWCSGSRPVASDTDAAAPPSSWIRFCTIDWGTAAGSCPSWAWAAQPTPSARAVARWSGVMPRRFVLASASGHAS
mmetsp:Transcript_12366/g.26858  ORF Transcript_12366/g.26858 Transcript_12366/m.26858 type:complete len:305 (-) Transcript_12366:180-1094(-)